MVNCVPKEKLLIYYTIQYNSIRFDIESINFVKCQILISNAITKEIP